MSGTASRRKPPRSAAGHNLFKPCPSPARWNGPPSRRNCGEPQCRLRRRLPFAATSGGPTTKLAVAGGPRVRIHLPPAANHTNSIIGADIDCRQRSWCGWRFRRGARLWQSRSGFAAGEIDAMGVVNKAVEDGVGISQGNSAKTRSGQPPGSAATARFSMTVSNEKISRSCDTYPSPRRARRWVGSPSIALPPIRIVPAWRIGEPSVSRKGGTNALRDCHYRHPRQLLDRATSGSRPHDAGNHAPLGMGGLSA